MANSIHVMKMCEAFGAQGHSVVLVGIRGFTVNTDIYKHYGVKNNFQIRLNRFPLIPGFLFIHAVYSLVIFFLFQPNFVFGRSFFSIFLVSLFVKRFSFESHNPINSLPRHFQYAFRKIIDRKNLRNLVVISEALKEIIKREYPLVDSTKMLVLHDGATVDTPVNGNNVFLKNGGGDLQIGYVGTINRGRGVELLLQIAAALPTMDFHIVGGHQTDLVAKLSIDKVPTNVFFYGFVPPAEAYTLMKKCDVLLAPYQTETFVKSGKNTSSYMSPLKVFEYMASKRPIVCSDLPVLREILNDSNSTLVEADNVNEWVSALKKMKASELRAAIAMKAFEDLNMNFTWEVRSNKILMSATTNEA